MMKRFFLLMIALLLIFTAACAVAEDSPYEAELSIGDFSTLYKSFTEAFNVAVGKTATIKLLKDVTVNSNLDIYSGNVTIDWNGKTVDMVAGRFTIGGNSTMLTFTGSGTCLSNPRRAFVIMNAGSLKITGDLNVRDREPGWCNDMIIMRGGLLEITGNVNFTCIANSGNSESRCISCKKDDTVRISNGTYRTVYVDENGNYIDMWNSLTFDNTKMSLSGGTFYGITFAANSDTRSMTNLLANGCSYTWNDEVVSTEGMRKTQFPVTVTFTGIPQTPALEAVIDDGVTVIRPESFSDAEAHTLSVSGGCGEGEVSVSVDAADEYLWLVPYSDGTAGIQVKKPETARRYTLTVIKDHDGTYGKATVKLELLLAANLVDDCTVECADIVYDTFAHTPAPVVTLPASAVDPQGAADEVYVLKEGEDYTLEYTTEYQAGSYTFKITGLDGILSGEKEFTWYIKKTPFSTDRISAKVLNPGAPASEVQYLVYDTVKGTRLEMDVDFTSNYQPKSEPGEYTFQLFGLGLYEGTIDITWSKAASIEDCEIAAPASNQNSPTVTVRYGEKTLVKGEDYTVTVPAINGVGVYTITVKGMGVWSGEKNVEWTHTMALNEGSFDVTIPACVHTGEAQTPQVTVTARVGDLELVQGTDFTVVYADNTGIGTATATITGLGLYQGTIVTHFEILNNAAVMVSFGDGTKYYSSFNDAFKALKEDSQISASRDVTITLLSDQETAGDLLVSNKTLTLRLNGHTLSNSGWANAVFGIMTQDGSTNYTYLYVYGPGSVTSENSVFTVMPRGRLILKNASVSTTSDYAPIININDTNTGVTIKDSRLYSEQSSIICQSYGDLTITGSTLTTASSGVAEINGGTTTISGSTFSSTGYTDEDWGDMPGNTVIGIGGNADITIDGGRFTTTGAYPVSVYAGNSDSNVRLVINGGTFTGDTAGLDVYGSGASITLNGGTFTGSGALSSDPKTLMSMLGSGLRYTLDGVNVDFGDENYVSDYIENHDGFTGDTHTVKVLKASIDITPVEGKLVSSFYKLNSEYTYTGEEIRPDFYFRYHPNGSYSPTILFEGTEYTVEITDNLNVGTATVVVTGIGDYTGIATKTFDIVPAALSDKDVIVLLDSPVYDGQYHTPGVEVFWGDQQLTDFTVELLEDGNELESADLPGTYTVRITCNGNVTGTIERNWTIQPKDLTRDDNLSITVKRVNQTETGFLPEIEVELTEGESVYTFTEGSEYTLSVTPTFVPGTYTAVVKLCGLYTGTFQVSYRVPAPIGSAEADFGCIYWNGSSQKMALTLKLGDYTLAEGTDYTIEGTTEDVYAGTYEITVYGTGNYYGSAQLNWSILPVDLNDCEVTLSETATVYPEAPAVTLTFTPAGSENVITLTDIFDYSITATNREPGNAYIVLQGKGDFTGSRRVEWTMYCAEHAEWTDNEDGSRSCRACEPHDMGEWTDGSRTCSVCGKVEVCGHSWSDWTDGERECAICDVTDVCPHAVVHYVDSEGHRCDECKLMLEHKYSDWNNSMRTCDDCRHTDFCTHSWSPDPDDIRWHACTICGKTESHDNIEQVDEEYHWCGVCQANIPHYFERHDEEEHWCRYCELALSHSWTDSEDGKKHVCTVCSITGSHDWLDNGADEHYCEECNVQRAHNWTEWAYSHRYCPGCNREEWCEDHSWGDWTDGSRACTVCGSTQSCGDHSWTDRDDGTVVCGNCGILNTCEHVWDKYDCENTIEICSLCEYTRPFVQLDLGLGGNRIMVKSGVRKFMPFTAPKEGVYSFSGTEDNGFMVKFYLEEAGTYQVGSELNVFTYERGLREGQVLWLAMSRNPGVVGEVIIAETTCEHDWVYELSSYYDEEHGRTEIDYCTKCNLTYLHTPQTLTIGSTDILVCRGCEIPFTAETEGVYTFSYTGSEEIAVELIPGPGSRTQLAYCEGSEGFTFTRYMRADETLYLRLEFRDSRYGTMPITVAETTCAHDTWNHRTDGTSACDVCGYECAHNWGVNEDGESVCSVCGRPCGHCWIKNEVGMVVCTNCGIENTCMHEWVLHQDGHASCWLCGFPCYHEEEEELPGVPPTYSEPGLSDGTYCRFCGIVLMEREEIGPWTDIHVLRLPESTKSIKSKAFAGTPIVYVIIPEGCTEIGSRAFYNCKYLYMVEIPESVTKIAQTAFLGTDVIFFVTEGSYAHEYAIANNIRCRTARAQ